MGWDVRFTVSNLPDLFCDHNKVYERKLVFPRYIDHVNVDIMLIE